MRTPPTDAYPAISEYALIGNRQSCALVSQGGSIEWCCLPRLDSPSVFGAILDRARGGRWSVAPRDAPFAERRYLDDSAALETTFRGGNGCAVLTDFMPIRTGRDVEPSRSTPLIMRGIRCTEGRVEVEVHWEPRPDYGRADVRIFYEEGVARAEIGDARITLAGLPESASVNLRGGALRSTLSLEAGEEAWLCSAWGDLDPRGFAAGAADYLEETVGWWNRWAAASRVGRGSRLWRDALVRSGMVLKILTQEDTGAIAAAPTTSLPEEIGGVRNWDYRFCWVRDSAMIAQAFATLGHVEDGIAFLAFLESAAAQHRDPARIQIMYGLRGGRHLPELTLGHLDGYRDSRPVRVGNLAAHQRQLDVYGELLEAAFDLHAMGAEIGEAQWGWLGSIADYVCEAWRYRDCGIWEVRGPERHFTYSKVMCWVALDRAVRLARALGEQESAGPWEEEREAIRAAVLSEGFNQERNSFVQYFGSTTLDASSLLIPLVGFLPPDDPRVHGTIDAIMEELMEDGVVHRYLTSDTQDGVSGGEGAFGICTFWLCTALARSGRLEEAQAIFEAMLRRSNDVGLFAEEVAPSTNEFLGNFPQAFTHVGLIIAARAIGDGLEAEHSRARSPSGEGSPSRLQANALHHKFTDRPGHSTPG
jgi:GH15 family glucan-1,4-alpha-glucosidase